LDFKAKALKVGFEVAGLLDLMQNYYNSQKNVILIEILTDIANAF
jgi:hypothetical protein